MPTLESLQFWALQTVRAQHPEWVFWSWFITGGKTFCFHSAESWRGSLVAPSDSVLWLEAPNLAFSKPSLEFFALFFRKDSIYWTASGEESANWGQIYRFESLLAPSSNSSETGNLVVVMGPLEGVQDVLGVSQSTATTRAKDRGAVISCLKNIYPCTDSIKKNISWPIHG